MSGSFIYQVLILCVRPCYNCNVFVSDKAPVCKCILGASFLSSVLINFPLSQYRHLCVYDYSLIVEKHQLWRLITARVAFLDVKDLMIGSILFYYFRTFERRYGSRKFFVRIYRTYMYLQHALHFNYLNVKFLDSDFLNLHVLIVTQL